VSTQGENARLTCQVPRTKDFCMVRFLLYLPDHGLARPLLIARHSRSGVAGISTWRIPSGESASTSALATAGMAPTQPASPAPLTPSGLVLVGTGLLLMWNAPKFSARGM